MEVQGISAATTAEPQPPSPLNHSDVAVESAEIENPLVVSPLSDEDGSGHKNDCPSHTAESLQDLRAKIVRQVEYYFSDENLPSDKFLLEHVKRDKAAFVPIAVIASFRRTKKLTKDLTLIVDALKESSLLVVSPDEKKVRRLHPLPLSEFKDPNPKLCTVLAENLPEDHSKENIQRIFGQVGNIRSICICDPHTAGDLKQNSKGDKQISGKLHALVEYETVEAAEKAAVTLNDEKDWRNGLHVQLLQKRMYAAGRKGRKGANGDKGSHNNCSDHAAREDNHDTSECHDDAHEVQQDGENLPKGRGRNRRSKGQKQKKATSGTGHGSITSSAHTEAAKPPPGPRMPDGTRGFTMGRGRPPV